MYCTRQKTGIGLLVLFILGAVFLASPSAGETDTTAKAAVGNLTATSDNASAASGNDSAVDEGADGKSGGPLSKLTVHGYLTQAYADASFAEGGFRNPTNPERDVGIPEDGTFDYRNLAIQFRYEISTKDIMIIQFSSRELGFNPVSDVEDEIELDWAFYERKITDDTSVKVGRVQLPFGIFNEYRDVGTILPFFRPPIAVYGEGTFTSETIDGVVLSHTFGSQSDWSFATDFYVGEWNVFEIGPVVSGVTPIVTARVKDAIGFQFWLNTPILGLRFGLGGNKGEVTGGLEGENVGIDLRLPGEATDQDYFQASAEFAQEKFVFRYELNIGKLDNTSTFFAVEFERSYFQAGYHPSDKFRIYTQFERATGITDKDDLLTVFGIPGTEDAENDFSEDFAVALNYLFSPNVVLKLEHHFDVSSEQLTFDVVPTPTGPAFQPRISEASDGEYTILSLSASF